MWGTRHSSNALQQGMHNKQTCWTAQVQIIAFTHPFCHHKTGTDKNTKGPSAKRAIYRKGRMSQVCGVSLRAHLPCAGVWPCLCYRAGLWQALFVTSTAPEANQRSLTCMALSYSYTAHKCSASEGLQHLSKQTCLAHMSAESSRKRSQSSCTMNSFTRQSSLPTKLGHFTAHKCSAWLSLYLFAVICVQRCISSHFGLNKNY